MTVFLYFADIILNFLGYIQQSCDNFYKDIKYKAFEHKLIYYAIYDLKTKRYSLIHNYDNYLNTFFFYLTNYIFKLNYAGITYLDLELLTQYENVIVITSYILNNKEYHDILNYDVYNAPRTITHSKVIYAYAETVNYKDDLTHEYELFKNSIFKLEIPAQDIYNILKSYKNRNPEKITNIKIMIDDTFEEKIYI
jgi:hypothetical protein